MKALNRCLQLTVALGAVGYFALAPMAQNMLAHSFTAPEAWAFALGLGLLCVHGGLLNWPRGHALRRRSNQVALVGGGALLLFGTQLGSPVVAMLATLVLGVTGLLMSITFAWARLCARVG